MALWDVESGLPRKVLRVLQSSNPAEPPPALDAVPVALGGRAHPPAQSHTSLRTEELDEPPPRPPGMRAVVPLAKDAVLTAGSDCAIRLWVRVGVGKACRSIVVCYDPRRVADSEGLGFVVE